MLRMTMIEVLFFEGCPGHAPTVELARRVAAEFSPPPVVCEVAVAGDEDAARLRFLGSPTVRVNGRDLEPGAEERDEFRMSCRLYRTGAGSSGVPGEGLIRHALLAAGVERVPVKQEGLVR
jgi:hypothetical protein